MISTVTSAAIGAAKIPLTILGLLGQCAVYSVSTYANIGATIFCSADTVHRTIDFLESKDPNRKITLLNACVKNFAILVVAKIISRFSASLLGFQPFGSTITSCALLFTVVCPIALIVMRPHYLTFKTTTHYTFLSDNLSSLATRLQMATTPTLITLHARASLHLNRLMVKILAPKTPASS
jgi:hypothetical protein